MVALTMANEGPYFQPISNSNQKKGWDLFREHDHADHVRDHLDSSLLAGILRGVTGEDAAGVSSSPPAYVDRFLYAALAKWMEIAIKKVTG